jgi:hypothetical protein
MKFAHNFLREIIFYLVYLQFRPKKFAQNSRL